MIVDPSHSCYFYTRSERLGFGVIFQLSIGKSLGDWKTINTNVNHMLYSDCMPTVQMNIRTPEGLINEVDSMVGSGLFKNRTEAVNEAIRELVRKYRILQLSRKMDDIAQNNFGEGSLDDALISVREEDDP